MIDALTKYSKLAYNESVFLRAILAAFSEWGTHSQVIAAHMKKLLPEEAIDSFGAEAEQVAADIVAYEAVDPVAVLQEIAQLKQFSGTTLVQAKRLAQDYLYRYPPEG